MMKIIKKKSFIFSTIIAALVGGFLTFAHAAGTGSLYIDPTSGSHDINTTFSVDVFENSGSDQVNVVQADLVYDASKLQFVSFDASGSGFNYDPGVSIGGNGSISIVRGVSSGGTVSGQQKIASINFKALTGSGSTSVSFAASSYIIRPSDGQDVWNGVTTGGAYTLTTPAVVTPPTPTPTPAPSAPSGASSPKSSTATKTSPVATRSPSATTQAASPSTPIAVINTAEAEQGYMVAVKVQDNKGTSIKGATVTLVDMIATSDNTGIASFTGIKAGEYTVSVKSKSGDAKTTITVASNKLPTEVQEFTANVKPNALPLLIEVGIGIIAILGIIFLVWRIGIIQKIYFNHKNKNNVSFGPVDSSYVNDFSKDKKVVIPNQDQQTTNYAPKPVIASTDSDKSSPIPGVVIRPDQQ